jgi:hypothetical protein
MNTFVRNKLSGLPPDVFILQKKVRYSQYLGLLMIVFLVGGCFLTWVVADEGRIVVSGLSAPGTNFGKPGVFHLVFSFFAAVFFLAPKVWAKRTNLFVCAFNLAWAVRNFIIISMCREGDCPEKKAGLYITLAASALMLLFSLLPDIKVEQEKPVV